MLSTLISLLPIASVVCGYPNRAANLVLHERRDEIPHGFQARGVDTSATLDFSIAVAQRNMTGLKAILDDISNHASPRYGQWMTKDQVRHSQFIYLLRAYQVPT
jgi:tripeptidyl-peptidase-1